ncbi:hypothetical protein VUR80DRAFT_2943 [Thermomyces stellatus]
MTITVKIAGQRSTRTSSYDVSLLPDAQVPLCFSSVGLEVTTAPAYYGQSLPSLSDGAQLAVLPRKLPRPGSRRGTASCQSVVADLMAEHGVRPSGGGPRRGLLSEWNSTLGRQDVKMWEFPPEKRHPTRIVTGYMRSPTSAGSYHYADGPKIGSAGSGLHSPDVIAILLAAKIIVEAITDGTANRVRRHISKSRQFYIS